MQHQGSPKTASGMLANVRLVALGLRDGNAATSAGPKFALENCRPARQSLEKDDVSVFRINEELVHRNFISFLHRFQQGQIFSSGCSILNLNRGTACDVGAPGSDAWLKWATQATLKQIRNLAGMLSPGSMLVTDLDPVAS